MTGAAAEGRRVALVTGGGTGVGAASALALAARGCNVALNYSRSAEEAERTAMACREAGAGALVMQGDVASDKDCRRMVAEAEARWGRVDCLVNSAGVTVFRELGDLASQGAEDFQRIYAVNVVGAYQMARAAEGLLRKSDRGAVVNVSSMSALTGAGSSIPYAASKGALNTLTRSLARALSPQVRVNAILPGMIATRWFAEGVGAERAAQVRAKAEAGAALGAVCTAEDVADGIVFLALDALKMTGVLMEMDGGATLGR